MKYSLEIKGQVYNGTIFFSIEMPDDANKHDLMMAKEILCKIIDDKIAQDEKI